jgi:glucose-1-phosphate thymidylyltransferase
VYLGDDLMRENIDDLVSKFDPTTYAAGIGLYEVSEPSRYGIVELNSEGEVVNMVEKPDDPPSNLALMGIYVFTPKIFEYIEKIEKSWRGEYEITDAIQALREDGNRIQSHEVHGWWKDTGKPKDVLHANRLVLDEIDSGITGTIEDEESTRGRIQIGNGSVIEAGATVRGPVSIGTNTTIRAGTYVGPYTSIGDDCVIDGAHLESSVLIGEATIEAEQTIVESLIGRGTTITQADGKQPNGARLVVGQNTSLEL